MLYRDERLKSGPGVVYNHLHNVQFTGGQYRLADIVHQFIEVQNSKTYDRSSIRECFDKVEQRVYDKVQGYYF